MSRSYRHTPVCSYRSADEKKRASRKARRTTDLADGGAFKKVYCSYFIGYSCYWDGDNKRK